MALASAHSRQRYLVLPKAARAIVFGIGPAGDILAEDAHEPRDITQPPPQFVDLLLVLGQLFHALGIRLRQLVRQPLGQLRNGQPAAGYFLSRPAAGHPRQCAQHIVQVVTQFGAELDLDREQACELFFSADDPVAAMGIVFAGVRISATQKSATDTTCPAMEDGLTFAAQQFATCTSDHGAIPPGMGRVQATAIFRAGRPGREVIARVSTSLSDTPILRDSRRKTRGARGRCRSAHWRPAPETSRIQGVWILLPIQGVWILRGFGSPGAPAARKPTGVCWGDRLRRPICSLPGQVLPSMYAGGSSDYSGVEPAELSHVQNACYSRGSHLSVVLILCHTVHAS